MKKILFSALIISTGILLSCKQNNNAVKSDKTDSIKTATVQAKDQSSPKKPTGPIADAATILSRKEVPILCYHQIRDWRPTDSKGAKDYIIPIETFKAHLKMLADSGYHSILPDQLYDYLTTGAPLPEKPVMLTFDDTDDDQFTIAAPEMKKLGYKGVFFIMTVSLNRPNYMTKDQVKQLSDEGHIVNSHTWDHHSVKGYVTDKDWTTQIEKPKKQIEEIIGKPTLDFAYPFGLWRPEAIPELKKRSIRSAYILSTKRDPNDPLYTIRRIIASGYWSANTLSRSMKESFK